MRYAEASYMGDGGFKRPPAISNSLLGMLLFIFAELMFFTALVSSYLVISSTAAAWPPPDQPRLPIELTALNSLVLFASGYYIFRAGRSLRKNPDSAYAKSDLKWGMLLGCLFVAVQGFEWIRMIGHGLTVSSSVYGAFFYLIIGAHAVHAVGAIVGLARLNALLKRGRLQMQTMAAGQAFWYFVVGIWPILYVLVYLS